MTRLVILATVMLGSLAAPAQVQTMDGEAVGRLSLELVGLLVTAFLLYLACSDAITALFWRRERPKRGSSSKE